MDNKENLNINELKTIDTASILEGMRASAVQMRELIVSLPAEELLGYIYSQLITKAIGEQKTTNQERETDRYDDTINESQFLLEYVHAVFASHIAPAAVNFDEEKCADLFEVSRKLMSHAMSFAIATTVDTKGGIFGPDTAKIEFDCKSTWVIIRGTRYPVLEGEFYHFVLAPHDDLLREIYGIGAAEIAIGFQDMANATRLGHANAIDELKKQFKAVKTLALEQDKPLEEVMETWNATDDSQSQTASLAADDLFRGGVANISRHTNLPERLLADLAYERGEETEFFAAGSYSGTPYRTLPARKKPLIKLGTDYYAIDPCFTRDAGYRALLHNLLQRKPGYKKAFKNRQKTMSENAFSDIFETQLTGATFFNEVYYKDPVTKQWVENDTLILIDDVLLLVEAKAGAAATIASPALDFDRHAQSVQDLVLKAYKQCERFFNYLFSADEVPIHSLVNGKYEVCGHVRRSDYRLMVPIGLTVESFAPFSAYCKEFSDVEPLLGKHAFISISIDDLFVLKRLLPTLGELAHYIEVRQAVAGLRRAHLFDEIDHLGAYITKNRFDIEISDQLKDGKVDGVVWDGMSRIVDKYFESEDWENESIPTQEFPDEVLNLLSTLDKTRASGWLSAESHIRNYGEQARKNLALMLSDHRKTLKQYPVRYFTFLSEGEPLFIWLQRAEHNFEWKKINDKASAAALYTLSPNTIGLLIEVNVGGQYDNVQYFPVHTPSLRTDENGHIYDDAKRMAQPRRQVSFKSRDVSQMPKRLGKIGRNEKCPCGSGKKHKKCHGS